MPAYPSAGAAGQAVAARMGKVEAAVRTSQRAAADKASAALEAGVRASAPARLRNAGYSYRTKSARGGALGVTVRTSGGAVPESQGRATGPWGLIEYDTPEHLIGIGKGDRRRGRVRIRGGEAVGGYLNAGGKYKHGVRGPIVHPGTKGKMVFHKGVAAATPKAIVQLQRTTVQAVKEVWH